MEAFINARIVFHGLCADTVRELEVEADEKVAPGWTYSHYAEKYYPPSSQVRMETRNKTTYTFTSTIHALKDAVLAWPEELAKMNTSSFVSVVGSHTTMLRGCHVVQDTVNYVVNSVTSKCTIHMIVVFHQPVTDDISKKLTDLFDDNKISDELSDHFRIAYLWESPKSYVQITSLKECADQFCSLLANSDNKQSIKKTVTLLDPKPVFGLMPKGTNLKTEIKSKEQPRSETEIDEKYSSNIVLSRSDESNVAHGLMSTSYSSEYISKDYCTFDEGATAKPLCVAVAQNTEGFPEIKTVADDIIQGAKEFLKLPLQNQEQHPNSGLFKYSIPDDQKSNTYQNSCTALTDQENIKHERENHLKLEDATAKMESGAMEPIKASTQTVKLKVAEKAATTQQPRATDEKVATTQRPRATDEKGITTQKSRATYEKVTTTQKPRARDEKVATTQKPRTAEERETTTQISRAADEKITTTQKSRATDEKVTTMQKPKTGEEKVSTVQTAKPSAANGKVTTTQTAKPSATEEKLTTTQKQRATGDEGITGKKQRAIVEEMTAAQKLESRATEKKVTTTETANRGYMTQSSMKEREHRTFASVNSSRSTGDKLKPNNLHTLEPYTKKLFVCGITKKSYGIQDPRKNEKVMLLVGALGSGKTTLVNIAANYLKNNKGTEDLFEVVPSNSYGLPATKSITAYTFCFHENDTPFTIIDTPGLTAEMNKESDTCVQVLKALLTSSDFPIHAIGIVVSSCSAQLTISERHLLQFFVMQFGESLADHIVTFVTFADSLRSSPVLETLRQTGIKSKLQLQLNTSLLTEFSSDFEIAFWKLGMKRLKKCFTHLEGLMPLSANTLTGLQNRAYSSAITEETQECLTKEVSLLMTLLQDKKELSKKLKSCDRVWELAIVVHRLQSMTGSVAVNVEETLLAAVKKTAMELSLSSKHCIEFLSLAKSRGLLTAGKEVLHSLAPLYEIAKTTSLDEKKLPERMSKYCIMCKKVHFLERTVYSGIKSYIKGFGESKYLISYTCTQCTCDVMCHENYPFQVCSFSLDELIKHTRRVLEDLLVEFSIPGFAVDVNLFVEYLNDIHNNKYHEFVQDLKQ